MSRRDSAELSLHGAWSGAREAATPPAALRRARMLHAAGHGASWGLGAVAARREVRGPGRGTVLCTAIVYSADGVQCVMGGVARRELIRGLADYVLDRSDHTLWGSDARHVRSLVARGELEAAIEVYFARVGDRWDQEWLVTTAVASQEERLAWPAQRGA